MPEEITNYQCPNCNGPLKFDPKTQKLACANCGSTFTTADIDAIFEEKNEAAVGIDHEAAQAEQAEVLQWSEEEKQNMRAYSCPSCGAQLIADSTTASTSCPYCGNPTVVPHQFDGSLKPDYIIPFKLVKDDAKKALKEFYSGKPLLPRAFTEQNHIEEIKGVYVPFWLYDGSCDAHIRAMGSRSTTHRDSKYITTITDHYRIERDGIISFHSVPADASSKMPDDFMDSIEPYDYRDMVPFEMSYLPGYLADRYDVTSEEKEDRVDVRMKNTTISQFHSTIGLYESLIPEREEVRINPGKVHYAFLPVWMLSTQYGGKNYLFAMNGQTGKMIGDDLPIDKGKMLLYWVLITVVGIAVLFVLLFLVMK